MSEADQGLIVAAMERVVLALGAKGLVNAQFIVREDGVYLIEVNPRASRTVPFLSKVTGVPMVELAVRIALGATPRGARLGRTACSPPPPFVAVKAPAFSTTKLRGVDPSVGPSMQSTGEVIGIHEDPRVALAKALRGAGLVPTVEPPAASFAEATEAAHARARSRSSRSPTATRPSCRGSPRALDRGRLPPRGDARHAGRDRGRRASRPIPSRSSAPSRTRPPARPPLLDLITERPASASSSTPRRRAPAPIRDAAEIRHTAIAEGVPCLTAIETAVAAAEALDPEVDAQVADVRSLGEWLELPERTGRLARTGDPGRVAEPDRRVHRLPRAALASAGARPQVKFTKSRLPNGLRLIISEDHLAPVAAVNVWYNVGSKHEEPGKTGFAHLFEHVMFQGSAHVGKAEHIALVQAAGGTMNGTTWLDRTNYFETMPAHQLELALWLEADRMGTLLDALSQENLDNQREVVKNEKRWSYDNRPYGSWIEKLLGVDLPGRAPVPPPDDRLDGGPRRRLDRGRVGVLPAALRAEQRGAVRRRRRRPGPGRGVRSRSTSAASRPTRTCRRRCRTCRCRRRSGARFARSSRIACRCPGSTGASAARCSATGASTPSTSPARSSPAARARGSIGGSSATSASPRTSPLFSMGLVGGGSVTAGWATARPGVDLIALETAFWEELERLGREPVSDDELDRAKALTEADELGALQRVDEKADRLSMYATLFDDPEMINSILPRYLSTTAEQIRDVSARRCSWPRTARS